MVGSGIPAPSSEYTTRRLRKTFEPLNSGPKQDGTLYLCTTGLPKGANTQGSRVCHSTCPGLLPGYVSSNIEGKERATGNLFKIIKRDIHGFGNNVPPKLLKLSDFCTKYKDKKVDRNLYNFLLDPAMFDLAYHLLKSKPGNLGIRGPQAFHYMTPGLNPDTLDGINKE